MKKSSTRKSTPPFSFKYLIVLITFLFLIGGMVLALVMPTQPKEQIAISSNIIQEDKVATPSATALPSPKVLVEQRSTGFCLNIPILLYHHVKPMEDAKKAGHAYLTVDPATFNSQMGYLASHGYNTISVSELASAIIEHRSLPAKSLVITFDDGYDDVYTDAYPILYKYYLKANLMISSGLIGNLGYLSWDDLKRMTDSNLISVSDHTWSHASLGGASDEKIRYEILTAKAQLEEKLGRTVDTFTYPYGSESQKVRDLLGQNGFKAAFSTIPGRWQCEGNIMSLRRIRIGNSSLVNYGI